MNIKAEKQRVDQLTYYVCNDRDEMGKLASTIVIKQIKEVLQNKEEVRIIFASAPSQNEFLQHLTKSKEIEWSRVVGFQMDEYIGLQEGSKQCFGTYLKENLVDKVNLKSFYFIDGNKDTNEVESDYSELLTEKPIDICCLGIGENGHIAFNDPPVADFNDTKLIKKVKLDQHSRQQQVNDNCFNKIGDVPTHALTLTIPALTSASCMVCTVPGRNKQKAVQRMLYDKVSTNCPATILRRHGNSYLFVDNQAYGRNKYDR